MEEDAYPPGGTIHFTIENRREETVYHDGCARQVAARRDPTVPWSEVFNHRGHCGFEPPREVIDSGQRSRSTYLQQASSSGKNSSNSGRSHG